MPKRSVDKILLIDTYYHVYNCALGKKRLFKDKEDYAFITELLKRYLSEGTYTDKYNRFYPSYRGELELISYNLQPTYIHLLILQTDHKEAMPSLMRSLSNAYTSYYNKKYRKKGPIFDGTYRASAVDNQDYLAHVSRHIHLVDDKYSKWPYSSLPYFLGQSSAEWLNTKLIQDALGKTPSSYLAFLADKEGYKSSLKYISGVLADA